MKDPKNKNDRMVVDQKLIAGVQKHFAGASLVLADKSFTTAEVVAFLQKRIDAAGPVETARAAWMSLADAEKATVAETQKFVKALRALVRAMFGTNVATLTDFGIALRKQATPKAEATVLKAARSKATRAARHTASPKQKAKIKGVVPTPPNPIQPAAQAPAAPTVTKPDAATSIPQK
jgi:hypothetical protein